jgi:crossover junction endodeoxyribonuclease RuvC
MTDVSADILKRVAGKLAEHSAKKDLPRLFFGIDPGWSGGLAVLDQWGSVVHASSFNERTETDVVEEVWAWLSGADDEKYLPSRCVIEKVWAFPGQGGSSGFKFGQSYGMLRATIILSRVPWEDIAPVVWSKKMKVPKAPKGTKKNKGLNLGRAQQLFPDIKMTKTGKTNSFYDALLLAEYGRRLHLGLEF